VILAPYLLSLSLLDYANWCVLQAKGNATAHLIIGPLKQTVWQLQAAKVKQWCSKIAE
jgi:hypothetical protein